MDILLVYEQIKKLHVSEWRVANAPRWILYEDTPDCGEDEKKSHKKTLFATNIVP